MNIELTKISNGVYILDYKTNITAELYYKCMKVMKPFSLGWVYHDEVGSDGNVYKTQHLAITFNNDSDAILFKMIAADF